MTGGGTITATDDPWGQTGFATARTFRLRSGASGITIQNLIVTRMTDLLKVEAGGAADVTLIKVLAERLGQYGVWMDDRSIAHIENCHIVEAHEQHGFRIYGDDVKVLTCSAYGVRGSSIWLVEGDRIVVDRFAGEQWLRFGPNHADASSLPVTDLFAREVHGADDLVPNCPSPPPPEGCGAPSIWVEMGVEGACLVNCCIKRMWVGRNSTAHGLNIEDTNWDALLHQVTGQPVVPEVNGSVSGTNVQAVDYNYCFADIVPFPERNNAVDIDDLLALISSWGDCPQPPTGFTEPRPICPADIAPAICGDGVVNIDDLLMMISNWGGCPAGDACGNEPPHDAGEAEEPPQSIEDCWQKCSNAFPGGGQAWADCFEACVEAVEEMQSGGGP